MSKNSTRMCIDLFMIARGFEFDTFRQRWYKINGLPIILEEWEAKFWYQQYLCDLIDELREINVSLTEANTLLRTRIDKYEILREESKKL